MRDRLPFSKKKQAFTLPDAQNKRAQENILNPYLRQRTITGYEIVLSTVL